MGEPIPFPLAAALGNVRSTSVAELEKGTCLLAANSLASTPFAPPLAPPFGSPFILLDWCKARSAISCSISIDVSDVLDELVELVELSSKLSLDVCECGGRGGLFPLTLAWDKPNSASLSRCRTPRDCESMAELPVGTKDGISGWATGIWVSAEAQHTESVAQDLGAIGDSTHAPVRRN